MSERKACWPALALVLLLGARALGGCGAGGDGLDTRDLGVADQSAPSDLGPTDHGTDTGPGVADADLLPADAVRFAPFAAAIPGGPFAGVDDSSPAPWVSCYGGGAACATEPCALLATCCVADGDCGDLQVASALPSALLFAECASGASALTCLPGQPLLPLGTSAPTVEAGGLRPGGDASQEGGVLVGTPVDLRVERVTLSVVFAPPLTCPGDACLESAGVSLARADEVALGVVNPLVGLLYSPSRGDVSLVIGDQVQTSWLLSDPNASFTLEAHPTGTLRVFRADELLTEAFTYAPREGAQVVLHGRNTELQGARIRSLHALVYRSEAPDTFTSRGAVDLVGPADVSPWAPRDAALASQEGDTIVVVEHEGAVYRGLLLGGSVSFESAQRLVADAAHDEVAMLSPALLLRPEGEAYVLYTAVLENGNYAIRARAGVDGPLGAMPETFLVASSSPGGRLDDPSVLEHGGRLVLVARHRRADTDESELRLWVTPRGSAPSLRALVPASASNLAALTRVPGADGAQEQVRAPSISVRGGTYRVHYERRLGTRRVIQLLVSDELRAFRALGEVLVPRPGELDALGVGAPSALQDPDGVEALYYMGRDGVRERLFVAERAGVLDPSSLRVP